MHRNATFVAGLAAAAALAAACSLQTPLTPATTASAGGAAADGSTLKVNAPTLVSPINDQQLNTSQATMVIAAVSGQFTSGSFTYEFELQNDAGSAIDRTTTASTSWVSATALQTNAAYRWRARATSGGAAGPWSATARFQAPKLVTPTFASSNDAWKTWFFALIVQDNVGPTLTVQALKILDPDLKAAGVIQETDSGGNPRGRLYLPTGSANNLFGRSVDLGNFGGAWQWLPKGGTVCEGGSC